MLCVVIKGPSFEEAEIQIQEALKFADLIELRLDCFKSWDLEKLQALRNLFSIPMIFTLRSFQQGGEYHQLESDRLSDLRSLVELQPEYLDLESHVPKEFVEEISSSCPKVKIILSYHNFCKTPDNLEEIYQKMQKFPAAFYKIAMLAKNSSDALRLLNFAKRSDNNLIAISMGSFGQISRILGPVIGSPITYASLTDDLTSAPGQLTAKILLERYRYRSLNTHTAIFGLIGDPVSQSIGDETHNHLFSSLGYDAVYVKMQVSQTELSDFLQLAKQLPFSGLSVTMPLKEVILPCLDEIDAEACKIGSVNTLLFENGSIFGFNTDGKGALNALEQNQSVKGKRLVVIGAGGAAKAIVYEAHFRGAQIKVLNKDMTKAKELANRIGAEGYGLDLMPICCKEGYEVLINCTSVAMPILSDHLITNSIVMDINTKPKKTSFIKEAKAKQCQIVFGYQMFVEQALGQFKLWYKNRFDTLAARKILSSKAEAILEPTLQ